MLAKLFKHEWKTTSKLLLIIHGMVVLFALISRVYLEVSGAVKEQNVTWLGFLLIFAMVMAIGSAAFFNYFYIVQRFYKSIFTDEGYLTNTLPVTPAQIILSKALVGIIWIFLDILVLIGAVCILGMTPETLKIGWSMFLQELSKISEWPMTACILGISVLLVPVAMTLQAYFSIAVGNMANQHKVLAAVGTFIGLYMIQQTISMVAVAVTGGSMFVKTSEGALGIYAEALPTGFNPMLLCQLILTILCIAIFWLGTRSIISKKLNLQ